MLPGFGKSSIVVGSGPSCDIRVGGAGSVEVPVEETANSTQPPSSQPSPPEVDDLRESPAIEICHKLAESGAKVVAYEPYKPEYRQNSFETVTTLAAVAMT